MKSILESIRENTQVNECGGYSGGGGCGGGYSSHSYSGCGGDWSPGCGGYGGHAYEINLGDDGDELDDLFDGIKMMYKLSAKQIDSMRTTFELLASAIVQNKRNAKKCTELCAKINDIIENYL